jgi:hypothetical protein
VTTTAGVPVPAARIWSEGLAGTGAAELGRIRAGLLASSFVLGASARRSRALWRP